MREIAHAFGDACIAYDCQGPTITPPLLILEHPIADDIIAREGYTVPGPAAVNASAPPLPPLKVKEGRVGRSDHYLAFELYRRTDHMLSAREGTWGDCSAAVEDQAWCGGIGSRDVERRHQKHGFPQQHATPDSSEYSIKTYISLSYATPAIAEKLFWT